jgi:hypothetical protein
MGTKIEPEHAGRRAQELMAKADQRRIQYEVDGSVVSLVLPYAQAFPKEMMEQALRATTAAMNAYLDERRLRDWREFHSTMEAHGVKLQ